MMDLQRILVIAYSARQIACSGKRAGYEIYAMDHFCDVDLQRCVRFCMSMDEIQPEGLNEFVKGLEVDAIILGPGFEREKFDLDGTVLSNERDKMEKVTNKLWLTHKLCDLGIPHPETYTADDVDTGKPLPLIAKPIFGSGGYGNRLIGDRIEIPEDGFLFQEYIVGKPASVSTISTRKEAVAIAVNEILSGKRWLTRSKFEYCGNITPFHPPQAEKMRALAESLVLELGLIGSNGVDFIVNSDGAFVIEVNPRFQGSLDIIELSTGINVFDAHVKAFEDELPTVIKPKRFAAKAIVFADEELSVKRSLDKEGMADIPPIGRIVRKGDPIATALGVGTERGDAIKAAMEKVWYIKQSTHHAYPHRSPLVLPLDSSPPRGHSSKRTCREPL
jgi:hypothetical protein